MISLPIQCYLTSCTFLDVCKLLNCHNDSNCGESSNYTCQCNPGFQGNGTICAGLCCQQHTVAVCNKILHAILTVFCTIFTCT